VSKIDAVSIKDNENQKKALLNTKPATDKTSDIFFRQKKF